EHILGSYVQGSIKVGRLNVTTGVRVEYTEDKRNQPVRERKFANTLAEWTTRSWTDAANTNIFPSIHSRYTIARNFIAHASFGTTSGRPDWNNLLGVADTDDTKHTISV